MRKARAGFPQGQAPGRVVRWLARLLWPGRKRPSTPQDLRHLQRVLRFVTIYALTVFAPALALAALGFSGIQGTKADLESDLRAEGEAEVGAALERVEGLFERFEAGVRDRVGRGLSPTDSLQDLSPYLRVAFRLDEEGRVAAPFRQAESTPSLDHYFWFSGPFAEGRRAEEQGDWNRALVLYERARREARGKGQEGTAALARARVLAKLGRLREAEAAYAELAERCGSFRSVLGFPLTGLARLSLGELLLARDREAGTAALVALVEELLADRWAIGFGEEAALARRALDDMEGVLDADTLASLRSRVDARTSQVYWAERLLPELEAGLGEGRQLKVAPGRFTYRIGRRALWATVWLEEDLYAFALDWTELQGALARFADWASRPEGPVRVSVLQPEAPLPELVFARRSLAPWFPGWALVAHAAEPEELRADFARRRSLRMLLVAFSLLLLGLGAVLTVGLLRREMELAQLKTAFAASVSHELRSPITQIRLKGEALLLGLAEDEEDRQRHYEAIVRETERLSRLVDNVLDFAAIERGTKHYHYVQADLGETLRAAVESMRFSMESRGLELEVEIPDDLPVLRHDPDAVAQVMTNLLSNAAKYGGGQVRVTAVLLPDGVQVEVADRGVGIDPREAGRLFEQFYRGSDPRVRRYKGTGIGLAIVRYVMEAHGGTVQVRPRPGGGSVFQLFFPFSPSEGTGGQPGG